MPEDRNEIVQNLSIVVLFFHVRIPHKFVRDTIHVILQDLILRLEIPVKRHARDAGCIHDLLDRDAVIVFRFHQTQERFCHALFGILRLVHVTFFSNS